MYSLDRDWKVGLRDIGFVKFLILLETTRFEGMDQDFTVYIYSRRQILRPEALV